MKIHSMSFLKRGGQRATQRLFHITDKVPWSWFKDIPEVCALRLKKRQIDTYNVYYQHHENRGKSLLGTEGD